MHSVVLTVKQYTHRSEGKTLQLTNKGCHTVISMSRQREQRGSHNFGRLKMFRHSGKLNKSSFHTCVSVENMQNILVVFLCGSVCPGRHCKNTESV